MNEENITLKDIVETIIISRWMLISFFMIAVLMAYFFYLTTPKMYTAEATILPITTGGSGGGMADFLAGTGLGMLANSETKANVILVAMASQTLAENVLRKFDITDVILNKKKEELKPIDFEKAVAILRTGTIKFSVTKNGSINVYATLNDPDKAAILVNTYLKELSSFFNQKSINMNFNIIDAAKPPILPSGPKLARNMIVSLGIAFFFGLAFVGVNMGIRK